MQSVRLAKPHLTAVAAVTAPSPTTPNLGPPAEKDAAKIKKLREKQEKQQMAAFRAHQVGQSGGLGLI